MRYVVIKGNIVRNVIEWDGLASWAPPTDCIAEPSPSDDITFGWLWNGGRPTNPNPSPPPPTPDFRDADTITKMDKVLLVAAAIMSGRTVTQAKAAFRQAWDQIDQAAVITNVKGH
jgi:hypothetical protein